MIVLLASLFDDGNTTTNNNSNNGNSNELENVSNVSGYADNILNDWTETSVTLRLAKWRNALLLICGQTHRYFSRSFPQIQISNQNNVSIYNQRHQRGRTQTASWNNAALQPALCKSSQYISVVQQPCFCATSLNQNYICPNRKSVN